MRKLFAVIPICLVVSIVSPAAQQSSLAAAQSSNAPNAKSQHSGGMCPMHHAHSTMDERSQEGMGFSQTATTHHFFLKPDGGVIQVEAKDPADAANRDNVRMHLAHIAKAFAGGDFDIPMFVHDTVPPGVPEMQRLREKIRYTFEQTPAGGRVLMLAGDKDSLAAIHKFLQFQIREHRTGDPTTLP